MMALGPYTSRGEELEALNILPIPYPICPRPENRITSKRDVPYFHIQSI
jgi:hypothetical protein